MDVNPYESPKHYAEPQKPVLVIRKKVVVPALCTAGLFYLACLYFDWNYFTWNAAEVIGDVLFAAFSLIFATLIAAGVWPRNVLGSKIENEASHETKHHQSWLPSPRYSGERGWG
jgi:hypothetical protein